MLNKTITRIMKVNHAGEYTALPLPLIAAISAAYSFLLLFRWKLGGIPPEQVFGRLWQYYVSWGDYGFFRRGFVGTLLTESGLNSLTADVYQFAYSVYACLLLLCYFLFIKTLLSHPKLRGDALLAGCILLSPALFPHFAYATSNQDLVLCIFLLLAVFYARNAWLLSAVLIAGLLTHELFCFYLPGIFLLKLLARPTAAPMFERSLILPALAAIAAVLAIAVFGKLIGVSEAAHEALMLTRIPLAAHQTILWSGYFEISSGMEQNRGHSLQELWQARAYLALPTLYMLLIAGSVARYCRANLLAKAALLAAILCPMLVITVASDYYRWVSMSALMGLVSMLCLIRAEKLAMPRKMLACLIIFSLIAPIGPNVILQPFPVQQNLWEKIAARLP